MERQQLAVILDKELFLNINTDGSGFQNLYNFTALNPNNPNYTGTNSDGANPQSGLILSGGILYGTAENGGSLGEYIILFKFGSAH